MRPPRWAEWLLLLCIPSGLMRDSVVGDMEEEFRLRAVRDTPAAARWWYGRQAVGIAWRYLARHLVPRRGAAEAPAPAPGRGGSPIHDSGSGGRPMIHPLVGAATHALRSLRQSPAFVFVTALTLALGVGATAAIFSVLNGVLLRPLPYADPEELVVLHFGMGEMEIATHSEPEILDIRREIGSFAAVAAYRETSPVVGSADRPERVTAVEASWTLPALLGVKPLLGRTYEEAEDRADATERVVVLSHGLWVRLFGADPAVVGRTLRLESPPPGGAGVGREDEAHTVIGVMPEGFAFPRPDVEAWLPLRLDPREPWTRNNHYLQVVARLAPRASLEAAAAELDALGARSTEAYPEFYEERVTFRPVLLREEVVGDVRTPLVLLLCAAFAVLLIAAVNAASLFLARGEVRRGEIAVRAALGAGRGRLAAQLLAESLLVAALAGGVGIAIAYGGVAALQAIAPPGLPRLEEIAVDARVLLMGLAVAVGTGLLFGVIPAAQGWRSDARDVLSAGGWGGIGRRRTGRVRRLLVMAQLSLATMLFLGAGLLIHSFAELRQVNLGFQAEDVLVVPIAPAVSAVAPDAPAVAFYQGLEERLINLPGVSAVGSAVRIPLASGHDNFSIQVEGRLAATVGMAPTAGIQWATPGYFTSMGIPLLDGRRFGPADHAESHLVAVVGERLARELWPGENAVGKRLRMFPEGMPWMEVVGVVGDVKHNGVQAEPSAMLYIPHAQGYRSAYYSSNALAVFVRAEGDPAALAPAVRAIANEIGPPVPIGQVRTMEDLVGAALSRERFTLLLLAAFAAVALFLAAVGVYGVVAHAVASRTREIGLRMAVGAGRGQVAGQVFREGVAIAAWGTALGMAGALAASRLLRAVLYGVSPLDPWTYAAAIPVLAGAVVLASVVPALRAARLDPVRALRDG